MGDYDYEDRHKCEQEHKELRRKILDTGDGAELVAFVEKHGSIVVKDFLIKYNTSYNRYEIYYNTDDKFMAALFDCVFSSKERVIVRAVTYANDHSLGCE